MTKNVPATPYIGLVNSDSPVAYYPLNGDAQDWSGNGHNGTLNGSITFNQTGLLSSAGDTGGKCALFDGSTGYISLPSAVNPTGYTAFSAECWLGFAALPSGHNPRFISNGQPGNNGVDFLINSGGASGVAIVGNGSHNGQVTWSQALATHTSYHYVMTYDGTVSPGVIRTYINGVLVTTANVTGGGGIGSTGLLVNIGRNPAYNGDYVGGFIQHVALYNSTLSLSQIKAHYSCGVSGLGVYSAIVDALAVTITPGSMNIANQIGQRSQGKITVIGPLGLTWQYGTAFELYDSSGKRRYSGFVNQDKVYKDDGSNQGTGVLNHDLTLMDPCYKADKRVVYASYLETTAGAIFQNLIDRVLYQEGVTYTATSIASGITIPEAVWNGKTISAAFDWLAQQSGFWWNIDINSVAFFQPYGGVPAPFAIDGSQVEGNENFYLTNGNTQYVNTQYVKGGSATKGTKLAPLDETFHGNGVTRSFTLSYPVDTIFNVILNGVDVTSSSLTKGSNGGQFYYAPSDAVIAQDPSQSVLTSGDTLEVKYEGRVPAIGKAQNSTLIATQRAREGKGSSGIVESTYSDTKIHTLPGALQIASALLSHWGNDATILDFDTLNDGLAEGQMLTVTLSDYGLSNKQMLINSVALSDQNDSWNVWQHVQAVGSPVETAQWQTYWQALMDQQSDPSDLSDVNDTTLTPISVSTFSHTPSFSTTSLQVPSPICGVTSGLHTMVCGNWVVN